MLHTLLLYFILVEPKIKLQPSVGKDQSSVGKTISADTLVT